MQPCTPRLTIFTYQQPFADQLEKSTSGCQAVADQSLGLCHWGSHCF